MKNIKLTKPTLVEVGYKIRVRKDNSVRSEGSCLHFVRGRATKTEAAGYLQERWGILCDVKDITLKTVW